MSAVSATLAGRALAERLMQDTCRVTVRSGETTWDEELGREVPTPPTVFYEGRCRFQIPPYRDADKPAAGEYLWTIQDIALQLPMDAPIPPVDADVEALTCALDPLMVGRPFRVRAPVPPKTHATRRTVACVEVTD